MTDRMAKSNNDKKPNRTLCGARTDSSKSGVTTSTAGKPTAMKLKCGSAASKPTGGSKPKTPATPAKPVKGKGNKLADAITTAKSTMPEKAAKPTNQEVPAKPAMPE